MSIYQRQYQELLSQEILKYLLIGKLPNLNQIATTVSNYLTKDGSVTYQYIPQPSRNIFQNEVYNKSLNNIYFDINLFHSEMLDMISKSSERISFADLYNKVNMYELRKLETKLKTLLFTLQDADFYFLGAFDTFSDISLLDKSESTENIINLSEQCLALPYGGKNTQKINTGHLYELNTIPVIVNTNSNILKEQQVAGTKFGNIFSDTVSAWAYEINTDSNVRVEISFIFPLAGSSREEIEVLINRLEVLTHSPGNQKIILLLSNDNVNYFAPTGYEDGILLTDQKTLYALDFETNLVQYIKVVLIKESADREITSSSDQKTYQYIFGLRNISALTVGRISRGRYQSKPFDFTEDKEKISSVSLDVNSIQPQGCKINYSIALTDEQDNLVTPFIPISPINHPDKVGTSKILNFSNTIKSSNRFTVPSSGDDAAQTYGRPFQGKSFYRIGRSINPEPIYKSCELYRGYNCWYRDSSQTFAVVNTSDTYISFEQSDIESLYTYVRESIPSNRITAAAGTRRLQVTLSKPVYYNSSRGHLMKPPPGVVNTNTDIRPNYAISKIILTSSTSRNTRPFLLQASRTQSLPSSNFIVQSIDESVLPVIRTQTGQILRRNLDYVILTEDVGGRQVSTGEFSIPDGSILLNSSGNVGTVNLMLEFLYTTDPDITHKVVSINNNFIVLDNAIATSSDSLEVTYRYIPTSPSQIIKSSIRVFDLPSSSVNRRPYIEGTDYIVSSTDGGIQRIPTGNISNRGSVYVDYSYRNAEEGIETFITWCNISDTAGIQLRFESDPVTKASRLVADSEVGEAFYVNTSQGLIDITNSITTPVIGPGWVQFVVRSKNPDANQVFRTNLINQVIQLRDENNKKIFKENNLYFNEIIAFRDPLKQITLNQLRVNTLRTDHTNFCIDSNTDPTVSYIVLNFLPNSTNELYNKGPTDDSDITSNPGTIYEEFLFRWSYVSESDNLGSKLIVRIDLERSSEADGSLTPKVYEYKIRASV